MADIDKFFNNAVNIARDLGKVRTARKQKQQDFKNLATNRTLDLEERRVSTGERRLTANVNLDQQRIDLDEARLAVRRELGEGQLDIGQRQVGVAEQGGQLEQEKFDRTGALFNRFFPDQRSTPQGASSPQANFRQQADQGVLSSARALAGSDRPGALSNPKIQEVINRARRNQGVRSTIEQDLLNLR